MLSTIRICCTAKLFFIVASFAPGSALATSLVVGNGSFEDPALPDGTNLVGVGSPWTVSRGSNTPLPLTENPAGPGVGVVDGEQRIRLRTGSFGQTISIEQTLPTILMANMTYVFAITPIDIAGGSVPQFQIRLDGLAARTVSSSEISSTLGREISVSATILPGDPMTGDNLAISVSVFDQSARYGTVSFDQARAWAVPVPEPSVASLLGLGLAFLGSGRRYMLK